MEFTFAIIKPDAVERGHHHAILDFMSKNFEITDMVMTKWNVGLAQTFYAEHLGKPFFGDLVTFMSSGPLICAVLVGPDAVSRWRFLIGETNPEKAAPGTMRSLYGRRGWPVMYNAVHGSDSIESAAREILWVKDAIVRGNLPGFGDLARARVQNH